MRLRFTLLLVCLMSFRALRADDWQMSELPVKLTVGYAVRAIDMNGDAKLDIAIVDSKRVLWLENPSWKEHVIHATPDAKADNVCFAPHDVDGDGLLDLALGADWQPNNTESGGSIGWLHQQPAGTWKYHELTSEPTTHRMHWVELVKGQSSLVVAPLKGPHSQPPGFDQTAVRLLVLTPPSGGDVFDKSKWQPRVLADQLHVMHNFHPTDLDRDGATDILCASYEGATWMKVAADGKLRWVGRLGVGQEQAAPARGASEIRSGRLASGRDYLATIEPWHGDKVVVYLAPQSWDPRSDKQILWQRVVIDDELAWGHAVACANIDNDADEELIIGVRDNKTDVHRCGVRVYDPDPNGAQWKRTVLDPGGVAVEDLVTADVNGDGKRDIIAVGRATHNARLYLNAQ